MAGPTRQHRCPITDGDRRTRDEGTSGKHWLGMLGLIVWSDSASCARGWDGYPGLLRYELPNFRGTDALVAHERI